MCIDMFVSRKDVLWYTHTYPLYLYTQHLQTQIMHHIKSFPAHIVFAKQSQNHKMVIQKSGAAF